MALTQQGLNTEGTGSISADIESSFFDVILEQKDEKVCFFNLGEAIEGMSSSDGSFFICGSFKMEMSYRGLSREFIQLENDYTSYIYKGERSWTRIVMGMSVSKMLVPVNELMNQIRDNPLDIWGRLYKSDRNPDSPSFIFKPFVVGFNWISSLNLELEVDEVKNFFNDIREKEDWEDIAPISVLIDKLVNQYGMSEEEAKEIIEKHIGIIF